jgi:PBP1b-binding outer membrane lipoprotein LpoB
MKKFMVGLILFGILSSCTYNTNTIQPDKVVKEVKNTEVNQSEDKTSFKTARDNMINSCNEAYDCQFIKKDDSEHFMVLVQNHQLMNSKTDKIASKAADFCKNSIVLNIPSHFYVVLVDERVVQKVDCSTSEWSKWYAIDELKNNRY